MIYDRLNRNLLVVLKWTFVLLVCKVTFNIVANYVDYFPPNCDSDFLLGRQTHFRGLYRIAFYLHIVASPISLLIGLVLLNERVRRRMPAMHRWLGRANVAIILTLVVPSGGVMSQYSRGGSISNFGFLTLALATAGCAVQGWRCAVIRHFERHQRWMLRCYILLSSAVTLRLIGGGSIWLETEPIWSYRFASWASWLGPLILLEAWFARPRK